MTPLLEDPLYLIAREPDARLEDYRDSAWVGVRAVPGGDGGGVRARRVHAADRVLQ